MEIKSASEAAEKLRRSAICGKVDLSEFAEMLAKAAECIRKILSGVNTLVSRCWDLAKDSQESEKEYDAKLGFQSVKMMDQVVCRKPRFLVRKII